MRVRATKFTFKTYKSYALVYEALNDTSSNFFTGSDNRTIWVVSNRIASQLKEQLDINKVKFECEEDWLEYIELPF